MIKLSDSTVSVIIPTYNRLHLLNATIQNIYCQTKKPSEIIVVDDGSTDGTIAWISRHYPDIIVVSNEGKGPGAARNTGLKIATGNYIKFFDSDDVMTTNTIEEQCKSLDNSNKQFVYSPYIHASQDFQGHWKSIDNSILQYFKIPESKTIHQWMCRGFFICIPSMMLKRELLDMVGSWREDVTAYEDWEYLWKIALYEPHPIHNNKCAFLYRIHGNQTTISNFSHVQRDKDKLTVLHSIDQNNDAKINILDKIWFKYYLNPRYNGGLSFYFRIVKKIGRLRTKTNWQPMHGVLHDCSKIDEFIQFCHEK